MAPERSDGEDALSTLTPAEQDAMGLFWAEYDAHYEEMLAAITPVLARMPWMAEMLQQPKEVRDRETAQSRELTRNALRDGAWAPYLDDLRLRARAYAEHGIDFASWFEVIVAFQRSLLPHIIRKFVAEPDRLSDVVAAANRFGDLVLRVMGVEYVRRKDEITRRHQEELVALSTPVLQLHERLLLVPLIGALDTPRANQLTEQLLRGIRTHRARLVMIDVTGVPTLDTQAAGRLSLVADSARLMGARVIVTGLSAEAAQTLATLGLDLSGLHPVGDLRGGLEEAERILHYCRCQEAQLGPATLSGPVPIRHLKQERSMPATPIENDGSEPQLDAEGQAGMALLWPDFDAHFQEMAAAMRPGIAATSEMEAVLVPTEEAFDALVENIRVLFGKFLVDGDWSGLFEYFRSQGEGYASGGVAFSTWFDLTGSFLRLVQPHVVERYRADPDRLVKAWAALARFSEMVLRTVGSHYVRVKDEITHQQHAALLALSTPVLQLHEGLLLLPVIGALDTNRANQLTEQLLQEIRTHRARLVMIDVTGVPSLDSHVANHLFMTVEAARLMGTQVIVTGLSPEAARALATLGLELSRLVAVGDLRGGLEEAERILHYNRGQEQPSGRVA